MKSVLFTLLVCLLCNNYLFSQVTTNFANDNAILENGFFEKNYVNVLKIDFEQQNIKELLVHDSLESIKFLDLKPFTFANPTQIDIDLADKLVWINKNGFSFSKVILNQKGALSTSLNFDKFYLPAGTEMYIYNENGKMITGPVTANENNKFQSWGTWVYSGGILNIELKAITDSVSKIILHSNNIAYGFKEIYKNIKPGGGTGQSGGCNINVVCPLGVGWENERNSVALVLNDLGQSWCSGSMVMNSCNTRRPFFLTANHCFNPPGLPQQNVSSWRFTFQAWSSTCSPTQGSLGTTFNGSTLRANYSNSDFCLVELSSTPSTNSNINYSGWNRSSTAATGAFCIHHPSGDVMKISKCEVPLVISSAFGTANQHWRAAWAQGVTEQGSSGAPLYDLNHRLVGQLHGGPSFCGSSSLWDFFGRFDLSWTGGGTSTSRLSDWLDPQSTGVVTTNTTNIANLLAYNSSLSLNLAGSSNICTGSATYTLSGYPSGSKIDWSISNSSIASLSINGNQATVTKIANGNLTISAIVGSGCNFNNSSISKVIKLGPFNNYEVQISGPYMVPTNYTTTYSVDLNQYPVSNIMWSWPSGWNLNYGGNNSNLAVLRSPSTSSTGDISISFASCGSTNVLASKWVAWGYGGPAYKAYPIPVSSVLNVELNEVNDKIITSISNSCYYFIVNQIGVIVKRGFLSGNEKSLKINVSDIPNGIYYLKLKSSKSTSIQKIIISH